MGGIRLGCDTTPDRGNRHATTLATCRPPAGRPAARADPRPATGAVRRGPQTAPSARGRRERPRAPAPPPPVPRAGGRRAMTAPLKLHRDEPATADQAGLIDRAEFCRLLSISRPTFERWLSAGRVLPPIRLSRTCHRWKRSEVVAWIE